MEREPFFTPPVEAERIGADKHRTEQEEQRFQKRRERSDDLSRTLKQWIGGEGHLHSQYSTREGFGYPEGIYDLREALAYYRSLGMEFVAFTEHSSKPGSPELLSEEHSISASLEEQAATITQLNAEQKEGPIALSGVEANIVFDETGTARLDVPDTVLEQLDFVVASRHGIAREKDLSAIEASLRAAAHHPAVDVIGHPDRYIPIKHGWDLFRANAEGAQAFHQETKALEERTKASADDAEKRRIKDELEARYAIIRKTIGEVALEPTDAQNGLLVRLREQFVRAEQEYWAMWDRILADMAQHGKAFEINLKNPPQDELLTRAVAAGVRFTLAFDAHDFTQFKREQTDIKKRGDAAKTVWAKGEASAEDMATLREYKADYLGKGPGVQAILRAVRAVKKLEALGVTPERVVNSSRLRLLAFLTKTRSKHTPNLDQLIRSSESQHSSRAGKKGAAGEATPDAKG